MKNAPLHIEEHELDQLLRQFVLDGGNDEFTQNTLTMNADIILNRPTETTPLSSREIELIQKLENAFIKRRGYGKFWLNGIIFLFVISAAVWIYKANSENRNTASENSPNSSANFSPVIQGDTSVARNTSEVRDTFVQGVINLKDEDALYADTSLTQTNVSKKEHYSTPDSHMPIEPNWYDGKTALATTELPGPVFTAKASPENFKPAQGVFNLHSPGTMFSFKPDSMIADYYTGSPFKSGMNDMIYFNYGEYAQLVQMEMEGKEKHFQTYYPCTLPWAVLQYANINDVKVETVTTRNGIAYSQLSLEKIPAKGIQLAMQPFYFRKYEVTNKEYREFMNWVRASNGYAGKAICSFEVDTIVVTNPNDKDNVYTSPGGKRYRLKTRTVPTEDYKEVFNYVFFNQNSAAVKQSGKNSLYIIPDTASWTKDFTYSYNEPMTENYFWHPAYDNYPVVGVSWYQAMAFLDWKTHMHQKQLDKENVAYEIEYTLPSDIEWELASISVQGEKSVLFNSYFESTGDWSSNLGISYPGHDDAYQRTNYLKNLFTKDQYFRGDYTRDGYFHTGPADLSAMKKNAAPDPGMHLDKMGISWMDGNVSEWMMESYSENWKPFFDKHLAVLDADTSESTQLAKQIEMLYDKGNARNGKLVRGANWYDERFSGRPNAERNDAGINPKRFVDPTEQHCTIGFRYVIHVKRK